MTALEKYNTKRDFSKTSEPKGTAKKSTAKLRFVVQRHHASRLHYDFRLEMDGVLKSWAVPKGPSLNPEDKRLAVMVEDHPVSYGSFEGDIPKGNYGYGSVSIFDEGSYEPIDKKGGEKGLLQELEKGSVKVVLKGKILKGEFALVKIKSSEDNAWLLIKHRDRYAVENNFSVEDLVDEKIKKHGVDYKKNNKGSKAEQVIKTKTGKSKAAIPPKEESSSDSKITSPMQATLSETIPDEGEWLFERKLDGFRAIAEINKKKINLISRNGVSFNKQYPSIVTALENIDRHVVLDGELVIEDKKKNSSFQLLQHGEPLPAKYQLYYYVFDVLVLDGNDLRDFELSERRDLVNMLLTKYKHPQLRLVESMDFTFEKSVKKASEKGWEGILAKETSSKYLSGKRTSFWRKIKFQQSQEAIIVGYTKPEGSRSAFGALVLAVQGDDGLVYVGNVGTGFKEQNLHEIFDEIKQVSETKKPFDKKIAIANERKVIWITPKLIAEISFSEWTRDQHMRHPVFKSLRNDKTIAEIKRVIPIKDVLNEREVTYGRIKLKLTNQKKMYWPDEGITKGEMLDYYESMAALILPYLKDKPISLNRFPNGILESSFFQKDMDTDSIPSWLKTVPLASENTGDTVNYLICNNEATLLWMANMGSIEINPWLSTYRHRQKPDFAVLDIDPNGVDFEEVVSVALTAYEILEYAGVNSYIKTSGSTGLHIYIYLGGQYDYELTRGFIQMLAELVHERHDETTSMERSPSKRKNKIYLDYMQNKKGQTIAAPYSVRPKPGATVSTPLAWNEVDGNLEIQQFTMDTVLQRVSTIQDPWADIFSEKVNLKKALEKF